MEIHVCVDNLYDAGPPAGLAVRLVLRRTDPVTGTVERAFHRTVIPPGSPVGAHMAQVCEHLSSLGYPALEPGEVAKIEALRPPVEAPVKENDHD